MAIPIEDHGYKQRLRDLDNYEENPNHISPQTTFMIPFGPSIWLVESSTQHRMVVIALEGGGGAWVWNPMPYRSDIADEIQARCGGVRHFVALMHNSHLYEWCRAFPAAKLYVASHMTATVTETVDFILTDTPMREYGMEIDQVLVRGSRCDEVVFFHKRSGTVIFGHLIHRTLVNTYSITGYLRHQLGYANSQTPKDFQLSVWWCGSMEAASRAVYTIMNQWKPTQIIVAEGDCAREGAVEIVEQALSWIPEWKGDENRDKKVTLETSLSHVSFTTGSVQLGPLETDPEKEQRSNPSFSDGLGVN